MRVNIRKLHPDAVIPQYAKPGDAGMDLTAISVQHDSYGNVTYGTGLSFEIPAGYVGLIYPRSSVYKTGLMMSNSVGVADSGYRGEVFIKFTKNVHLVDNEDPLIVKGSYDPPLGFELYKVGDRVAQIVIMPYPRIQFVERETLSSTERGSGGFGSTGL